MLRRILPQAKTLAQEIIQDGDSVVDATCGNGHDTKFLSELVGTSGRVYSFDIQEEAIAHARTLCSGHNNIEFILDSHEHVDRYIGDRPLKAAMFNLGYLPRGDKSITTTPAATMLAIQKLFDRLADNGRIIIVVYHGHPEGKVERDALMKQLAEWPQKAAQVLKYQFINQRNDAPFLLCIEKSSG